MQFCGRSLGLYVKKGIQERNPGKYVTGKIQKLKGTINSKKFRNIKIE